MSFWLPPGPGTFNDPQFFRVLDTVHLITQITTGILDTKGRPLVEPLYQRLCCNAGIFIAMLLIGMNTALDFENTYVIKPETDLQQLHCLMREAKLCTDNTDYCVKYAVEVPAV